MAVTVAVPTLAEVTRPEDEIVATVVGVMLHPTDGWLARLPSLFVPVAVICTVFPVLPVSMVGEAGPTDREVRVGFTKKPLQLMANAKMARAPMRRSWCFMDDINVLSLPARAP